MTLRSADNLIVAVENQQLENLGAKVATQPIQEVVQKPEIVVPEPVKPIEESIKTETLQKNDEKPVETPKTEEPKAEVAEKPTANLDEYGNEIPKPRTYSETEVQEMIRDRLRRVKQPEAAHQPPPVTPTNPESHQPEEWETQLEGFVENTLSKVAAKQQQIAMQRQEQQLQAQFEVNFNMGMAKFKDFTDVVAGKPITDSMMLAARSMKDPAAFIYAASKNHAAELDRIARIPDAYHQAVEIGKLEEKMKKVAAVTQAPRAISPTHGDMGLGKDPQKKSIDQLIHEHAKSKFGRG